MPNNGDELQSDKEWSADDLKACKQAGWFLHDRPKRGVPTFSEATRAFLDGYRAGKNATPQAGNPPLVAHTASAEHCSEKQTRATPAVVAPVAPSAVGACRECGATAHHSSPCGNRICPFGTSSATERRCPYCTSDNEGIRSTYYDQTCVGCVKRMAEK